MKLMPTIPRPITTTFFLGPATMVRRTVLGIYMSGWE